MSDTTVVEKSSAAPDAAPSPSTEAPSAAQSNNPMPEGKTLPGLYAWIKGLVFRPGLSKPESFLRATTLASRILFSAVALTFVLFLVSLTGLLSGGRFVLAVLFLVISLLLLVPAMICQIIAWSSQERIPEKQVEIEESERLNTELELARNIQTNMLPNIYPAFPEREEFDVYARMEPAKELGGDFFDFQMIDKDHLALIVADVAGKGIPAAMFMMASKIIISNMSKNRNHDPAKILKAVNRQIGANNHADMFVTLWLGILDIPTGVLSAANAGHEYPCLKHRDYPFRLLKDPHGLVLGVMDKTEYRSYDIQLLPGDTLFIYTDGVTEAANAEDELFGTDRMVDALNLEPAATVAQLVDNVRGAINSFVGEAPQADDITMMALRYYGESGRPNPEEEPKAVGAETPAEKASAPEEFAEKKNTPKED